MFFWNHTGSQSFVFELHSIEKTSRSLALLHERPHFLCNVPTTLFQASCWQLCEAEYSHWEDTAIHSAGDFHVSSMYCTAAIIWLKHNYFSSIPQQPPVGQGLHIIEASRSYSHTTLGTTPLDEWSAQRTDLYLTTHNTHKRHTSMPPVGFEPAIPESEQSQTHSLDRTYNYYSRNFIFRQHLVFLCPSKCPYGTLD